LSNLNTRLANIVVSIVILLFPILQVSAFIFSTSYDKHPMSGPEVVVNLTIMLIFFVLMIFVNFTFKRLVNFLDSKDTLSYGSFFKYLQLINITISIFLVLFISILFIPPDSFIISIIKLYILIFIMNTLFSALWWWIANRFSK
jgi:hypothetical protein